jgi:hypothetical protein
MAQQRALPRLRRSTLQRENRASITQSHRLADQGNGPPNRRSTSVPPAPARVRGPFAVLPEPHLALDSIAAPATATAFLLVSLSKMPRSIPGPSESCPEAFPIKANDYSDNGRRAGGS